MRKTILGKRVYLVIVTLLTCILFSSCRYKVPDEKRIDVISGIAEIVHDNYTSDDVETPLYISMTDIEELADKNSELYKAIEKYDDVQKYKVHLLDDNKIIIVTEVPGLQVKGYLVSDEELEGTITIPGMGFDADSVRILNRIEDSNIYYFSSGQ